MLVVFAFFFNFVGFVDDVDDVDPYNYNIGYCIMLTRSFVDFNCKM